MSVVIDYVILQRSQKTFSRVFTVQFIFSVTTSLYHVDRTNTDEEDFVAMEKRYLTTSR